MKNLLSAKIHGIKVTDKDINYVGSVTIDRVIMDAAGIVPFEKVQVVNLSTGDRWETYAVEGEPNSGVFALNGGSARLGEIGDNCLVITYVVADECSPVVVFLSEGNRISKVCNYKECPEIFGRVVE